MGPKQRRWSFSFFAHAAFYIFLPAWAFFVLASVLIYDHEPVVEIIPATRDSSAVIDEVQQYLQTATYRGYHNPTESLSCWDRFEDRNFTADYLSNGSWRVSAFYSGVRYYWRVDDLSMEVSPGRWFTPQVPTIDC